MKFRWHVLIFLLIFGLESSKAILKEGNSAPVVGDSVEVHNIAYSLIHGHGYSFDWNDEQWRKLFQDQNADGRFDPIVFRRGSHPTMLRPPLMPMLVAVILKFFPHDSFLAWRIFDSAVFAVAACFLCEVAFVHGGIAGLTAVLIFLVIDPIRRDYLPGWWSEGLAFCFLTVTVWLIANGGQLRPVWYNVGAGLAVGLLCLDRPIFLAALPLICLTLAIARRPVTRAGAVRQALVILALAVSIQMPWWIRNTVISGGRTPLGTISGFNMPDDYGDNAMLMRGEWTSDGMTDAWIPRSEIGRPILIPGFPEESLYKLWPPKGNDHRIAAMLYALVCPSLESEITVSRVGQRAGMAWIRSNYSKLPKLMLMKIWTQTMARRSRLARSCFTAGALLVLLAFLAMPKERRTILCLGSLIASYLFAVALTHAVRDRYVVPMLPSLYIVVALGISSLFRLASGRTPQPGWIARAR